LKDGQGACKGCGWITFRERKAFEEALSWNGCAFGGRHLQISKGKAAHTGFRPTLQAAGTHTPALLKEVRAVTGARPTATLVRCGPAAAAFLCEPPAPDASQVVATLIKPSPDGVVVDATYGRGGHTRGMLASLSHRGRMHAFDMDAEAIKDGTQLAAEDTRFRVHHQPFSAMRDALGPLVPFSTPGTGGVSAVLFDLGISSPQFDEASRGFRLEADGPLDLRFDQSRGETAHEFLMRADRLEIVDVLSRFGETTDPVADAICVAREQRALPHRTKEFAVLVARAKGFEYQAMHPAKLTFQALRVHLNDEFGECQRGLEAAFELLEPGGRIGVITWKHSECNLVVDFYRAHEAARPEAPQMAFYSSRAAAAPLEPEWALLMEHTIRPSAEELQLNSRARSAVLHILKKVRAPTLAQLDAKLYPLMGWALPPPPAGEVRAGGGGADRPAVEGERRRKSKELREGKGDKGDISKKGKKKIKK
jgi:16S rRNA (cytosine1402-N4)-methyltransferase